MKKLTVKVFDPADMWEQNLRWLEVDLNINNITFMYSDIIEMELPKTNPKKDAVANRWREMDLLEGKAYTHVHMTDGNLMVVNMTRDELNEAVALEQCACGNKKKKMPVPEVRTT